MATIRLQLLLPLSFFLSSSWFLPQDYPPPSWPPPRLCLLLFPCLFLRNNKTTKQHEKIKAAGACDSTKWQAAMFFCLAELRHPCVRTATQLPALWSPSVATRPPLHMSRQTLVSANRTLIWQRQKRLPIVKEFRPGGWLTSQQRPATLLNSGQWLCFSH